MFFEVFIFLKTYCYSQSQEIIFKYSSIFRLQTFGKFYMVKINYFSKKPNKMKERF